MQPIEFEGTMEAAPRRGACIPVPFEPADVFGTLKSVRVLATYDGFEAKSNVVSMDGRAVLGVHKATREAIGKGAGETVLVTLVVDGAERTVDIPPELASALAESPDLEARFNALAFTYRKEFARWVGEAKKAETRERRLAKAIDMITRGERL